MDKALQLGSTIPKESLLITWAMFWLPIRAITSCVRLTPVATALACTVKVIAWVGFGCVGLWVRLLNVARLAAGLSAAQGPSTLQVLARATLATVQQAAREPGPRGAGAAAPAAPAAEVASALPKASATDKAPHDDRVGA